MSSILLMPTVRIPSIPPPSLSPSPSPVPPPRSPRLRPTTTKLIRARSASASHSHSRSHSLVDLSTPPPPILPSDTGSEWLGLPLRFHVVQEQLQVEGYQMYAVEKWIVERTRAVTVLTVHTGNPAHKISVTALAPSSALLPNEAQPEWDKALHHLRRDGARPKQTPHGLLMATSLAHFRSDFTIVHIPDGNFLAIRDQLYTNINLLRTGCSGRSALTLQEPSDTSKERFISTYHLPDTASSSPVRPTSPESLPILSTSPSKHSPDNFDSAPPKQRRRPKTKDSLVFNATVLELVKLVQASLAIFGMFAVHRAGSAPLAPVIDGLLCDLTVDGIRRWIAEIGEPCIGLEPMERIADPMFVSGLLSLVLAIRNKLAALGYNHIVPKDPFLQPQAFLFALGTYVRSTSPPTNPNTNTTNTPAHSQHGHSHSHSHFYSPGVPVYAQPLFAPHHAPNPVLTGGAVLTRDLVDAICAAYEGKARVGEGRKVRRVLREKLDDLTSAVAGVDRDTGELEPAERRHPTTMNGDSVGSGGGGSGGGQILSGIGSLASGLGLGGGASGAGTACAAVLEGTWDLAGFVKIVVGKEKGGEKKGRGKSKNKEKGVDDGGLYGKDMEDRGVAGGIGGCARGLWSGRVMNVVRLREWELEQEMMCAFSEVKKEKGDKTVGCVASDGDGEELERAKNEKSDGRTTEEESDMVGGFGGMWGERVQKKLELWTGLTRIDGKLNRKKGPTSVDLSTSPTKQSTRGRLSTEQPLNEQSATRSQSPLLSPSGFVVDPDDDDLLSSGQVSPIGESRALNPFHMFHDGPSAESSALIANVDYERRVSEFNQKRPWANRSHQSRVSTWADPISAREVLDGDGEMLGGGDEGEWSGSNETSKGRRSHMRRVLEEDGVVVEEPVTEIEEVSRRKRVSYGGTQRRRSFHDVSSLRGMDVLTPERMSIDVELCGQMLIMSRREQHLQNVLACIQVLTDSLSSTNTALREDYETHLDFLSNIEACSEILTEIDAEQMRADMMSQTTNTVRYESEQFSVPDLWHTASPHRQKVLALREKVFGTGGRRLPAGMHGAHGRFNRLQWTIDGRERLVDHLGRTESEAEEESGVDLDSQFVLPSEEDEEDVVKHPGIKPMWLLRFFTSWGARWGAAAPATTTNDGKAATDLGKAKPQLEESNSKQIASLDHDI